jgi:hypothetical protein
MRNRAYRIRWSSAAEIAIASKLRSAVLACLLPLALLGCAAAYNARTDLAPDDRHAVNCYVRGALGRRYYRETPKRIVVSIYSHGPNDRKLLEQDLERQRPTGAIVAHAIPGLQTKLIFEKQYSIRGSDVSWRSVWRPDNGLSVVFYDYGRDEAVPYAAMQSAPERLLLTINFAYDPTTGGYTEAKLPPK